MSQHISIPSRPIINGSVAALINFPINYNTTGITTGVLLGLIRADAKNPVLLEFFAEVVTAFNGATNNVLLVGSDLITVDQFLAAADITEGTAGFYPASNANKKYRIVADTPIYVMYNGGVQATGTYTSTNAIPVNNSTVTIADPTTGVTEVYTFVTGTPTNQGDVKALTDGDTSLLNLIRAINHSGTPGTDYVKTAASKLVTAATSITSHGFAVTAIRPGTAGNNIATTSSTSPDSHATWGATTLGSGTSGSPSAGAAIIYCRVNPMAPSPSSYLGN